MSGNWVGGGGLERKGKKKEWVRERKNGNYATFGFENALTRVLSSSEKELVEMKRLKRRDKNYVPSATCIHS